MGSVFWSGAAEGCCPRQAATHRPRPSARAQLPPPRTAIRTPRSSQVLFFVLLFSIRWPLTPAARSLSRPSPPQPAISKPSAVRLSSRKAASRSARQAPAAPQRPQLGRAPGPARALVSPPPGSPPIQIPARPRRRLGLCGVAREGRGGGAPAGYPSTPRAAGGGRGCGDGGATGPRSWAFGRSGWRGLGNGWRRPVLSHAGGGGLGPGTGGAQTVGTAFWALQWGPLST